MVLAAVAVRGRDVRDFVDPCSVGDLMVLAIVFAAIVCIRIFDCAALAEVVDRVHSCYCEKTRHDERQPEDEIERNRAAWMNRSMRSPEQRNKDADQAPDEREQDRGQGEGEEEVVEPRDVGVRVKIVVGDADEPRKAPYGDEVEKDEDRAERDLPKPVFFGIVKGGFEVWSGLCFGFRRRWGLRVFHRLEQASVVLSANGSNCRSCEYN